MNGNSCKSISPLACSVRESHSGEREGRSRAGILYSIIAQYSYVLQPKVTLALFSRIPSFRKGKMRSRTNRLSILAFLHVSRRDISVWKWALKPACLIQLWFTIVSKMAAETKKKTSAPKWHQYISPLWKSHSFMFSSHSGLFVTLLVPNFIFPL